jgi:hypothetical protein
MLDPVQHFIMFLFISGKSISAEASLDLDRLLHSPQDWRACRPPEEPDNPEAQRVIARSRFWEARSPLWHITVTDFPISDQPGRNAGDRGQAVCLGNLQDGALISGDSYLFHQVGAWMVQLLDQTNTPMGHGKTVASALNLEKEKH